MQQIKKGKAIEGVAADALPGADAEVARRRPHRERASDALPRLRGHDAVTRRILIVDDEQGIRAALGQLLEFEGYEVRSAANAVDGLAEYARFKPHLVFMDVKMAGIDGLEALRKLREQDPGAIVVMISGHATIQTAVEATQHGAYDILEKPLDTDRILVTLRNALAHLDLHEENARLRDTVHSRFEIVGESYAIRARHGEDRARGEDAGARAHHRRERHGQGARRAGHPRAVRRARRGRSSR